MVHESQEWIHKYPSIYRDPVESPRTAVYRLPCGAVLPAGKGYLERSTPGTRPNTKQSELSAVAIERRPWDTEGTSGAPRVRAHGSRLAGATEGHREAKPCTRSSPGGLHHPKDIGLRTTPAMHRPQHPRAAQQRSSTLRPGRCRALFIRCHTSDPADALFPLITPDKQPSLRARLSAPRLRPLTSLPNSTKFTLDAGAPLRDCPQTYLCLRLDGTSCIHLDFSTRQSLR